jgi:hypothetical protein
MNIFYLARDPKTCAAMLCDKHVVKMILETAQLLSTAHSELGSWKRGMYQPTHKNHPCAIWARTSGQNYQWLLEYGQWLLSEYNHRYGKHHKTSEPMWLLQRLPKDIPIIGFSSPPKCMPDEYKFGNTIWAYRKYYFYGKKHIDKRWTNRKPPEWHNEDYFNR